MDVANKDGIHHMVKVISVWDDENNKLFLFTLDADACDDTNIKVVEAVDHSMLKLDYADCKATLQNTSTNSGGGGVYIGLFVQLSILQRLNPNVICHTCTLHALCLMFSNPVIKYLETGGVKNLNSVQLLYACYSLEDIFEIETFKSLWKEINKETYGNS